MSQSANGDTTNQTKDESKNAAATSYYNPYYGQYNAASGTAAATGTTAAGAYPGYSYNYYDPYGYYYQQYAYQYQYGQGTPAASNVSSSAATPTQGVEGKTAGGSAGASDAKFPESLRDWSTLHVYRWVSSVSDGKYKEYALRFVQNEICGRTLADIEPKDLDIGLYMNNMRQRIDFYKLVQELKKDTSEFVKTMMEDPAIMSLYPPSTANETGNGNATGENGSSVPGSDSKQHGQALQPSLDGSQPDKLTGTKRNLPPGERHMISWEYRDDPYPVLSIQIQDTVVFKWNFTKDVVQFADKESFEKNNFRGSRKLAGFDSHQFEWNPDDTGTFYFGCQAFQAARRGNTKIEVIVSEADQPPSKRQRV